MPFNLGLIGGSPGNGHPYSWSAILNGYDPSIMSDCPFPVIPEYLGKQTWPSAKLPDCRITHLFTDPSELASHIADACFIENVVQHPSDMLGQVDALLLARDDAENHLRYSEAFIAAGLPTYIDKPLGYSIKQVEQLEAIESFPGQIFSCSALRFSNTVVFSDEEEQKIGNLLKVRASGPGEWSKYSIHLIDALFDQLKLSQAKLERLTGGGIVLKSPICQSIELNIDNGMTNRVFTFCYEGSKGVVEKRFDDTFESFRAALAFFIAGDCRKVAGQFWSRYKDIAEIIEMRRP